MTQFPQRPTHGEPRPLWANVKQIPHYSDDAAEMPQITPYFADQNEVTAAVVVCPGGGYVMRADHEGRPIAEWLNSLGIAAFVVDYRVAPNRHPVPLLDAARAVRTVRYNSAAWGIDPARIGILGFSAGGHLAATVATQNASGMDETAVTGDDIDQVSGHPDLAVLCYPVISFVSYAHGGSRDSLLGADAPVDTVRALSAELRVTADTPPTFLWHTADDGAVPVQNSLLFADALSEHGVPFDLHVYQRGHHGIGLAHDYPHARNWTSDCASWLQERGFR